MFKKPLKFNLQRFNDGDPTPTPTPAPTPTPNPTPAPTPSGKVWTDEYVQGLREEAKENRLAKKNVENLLRTALGLTPDDELSEAKIKEIQKNQTKAAGEALAKANARLLSAEIKSLDGYDAKLVERLLDKSKVTIDENGVVTGLTEAVAELEKEFPSIKVGSGGSGSGVNPAGAAGGLTELQQLEEDYKNAPNSAARIAIVNKIHALQSRT